MSSNYLIPLMVLVPLAGALALLLVPRGRDDAVRFWALLYTLITFGIALAAAGWFFAGTPGSAPGGAGAGASGGGAASGGLNHVYPWVPGFGLSFGLGFLDSISVWLVLLTTFLMPLTVLGSFSAVRARVKEFYLWLLLLEAAMLGVFVATDLIFFYICFEFTLVPLYFLIGIFGSHQRLRAARVFFLYTFTGSMLTFAGVLYVAWQHALAHGGAWTFDITALYATGQAMTPHQQTWVLLALLAGFAVKVPIWPLHTWLPLAHTEAPTAGSVILAGVLLKLGTYGLLRFAIPMTPLAAARCAPAIAVLAIIGILYTALVCWVQKDVKKLIAYSSVSHLGFCVLGMFALNAIGMTGSVMYMINHGLSTGALFLCVGMIYERFHTREMAQMRGLAKVMPVWACFMVFFALASVGLPGLNGFVGEFLTLLGTFDSHSSALGPPFAIAAALGMVFGAIYIFYMLGQVVFGPLKVPAGEHGGESGGSAHGGHGHGAIKDLGAREIATLLPLAAACLWLGLYPQPVLDSLQRPLAELRQPAERVAMAQQRQGPGAESHGTTTKTQADRLPATSAAWPLALGPWPSSSSTPAPAGQGGNP